jgi:hypothetical protein
MADPTQNALLQVLFQNTPAAQQDEDGAIPAPLLDPEVRRRLNLDTVGAPPIAKKAPNIPRPPTAAFRGNPFISKFAVSGPYLTPEDRARQQDNEIQFKDLLARQDSSLDRQREALQEYKDQGRPGWVVPAAGLLDTVYGGNQREAAKEFVGANPDERAKAILKMEDEMNHQRAAMSNQVKALIDSKNTMRMAEMADKNNRFQQGQDMRLNMAFNHDVQQSNKTAWEAMQQINPIEMALQADANGMVDIARVTQALSQASRLMGERGVLTDQDIERVHKQTIDQKVAEITGYLTSHPSQPVPQEIVAPLKAAIEDGKRSMTKIAQSKLQTLRDSYVNGYGLRPEVGDTVVNQVYVPQFQQGFAPSGPPQAGPVAPGPIDSSRRVPPAGMNLQQFREFRKNNGG